MRGELTGDPTRDRAALDEWAGTHTDGLVPEMPVRVTPTTALVLASALSLRTGWAEPFRDAWQQPAAGPWRGRRLAGLSRVGHDLDALRAVDTGAGPLKLLTVRGAEDVDVVLALGAPGRGRRRCCRPRSPRSAHRPRCPSPPAPASPRRSWTPTTTGPSCSSAPWASPSAPTTTCWRGPRCSASPPPSATATTSGIAPLLAVSQARQSVTATFGATGFRAAAVTAVSTRAGSAPRPVTARKRRVRLDVDRPFGFLAVHRPSGLVLLAGWVTDPDAATPDAQRSPARLR